MLHKNLKAVYVDDDGVIQFGLLDGIARKVSGSDILLQKIIIHLFTDLGSNAFNENIGGNIQKIFSSGYSQEKLDLIRMDFINNFEAVESQIKEEQSKQTNLDLSERLSSLELKSVDFSSSDQSWEIVLKINTYGGLGSTFKISG